MKFKKPKRPKLVKPSLPGRSKDTAPEDSGLPRITNDTVAAHREEVLSSARKYIYPLQHSKHRVVKISVTLFIAAIIAFFTYISLALYKFQSSNSFVYGVTQVLPFPVATAGKNFVSYNSYLFELRHYIHYYESQQQIDFSGGDGKAQLDDFKKRSLSKVIDVAYAKELARKHNITVSNREIDAQIALVRSQNRLGASEQVFRDVLREFWGWSVTDFRRQLKDEIMQQKVVNKLDVGTHDRANIAYARLQQGVDFATVAKEMSQDDATAASGGVYPIAVERSNRDIPPQLINALFSLQPGQYSKIINTGYRLEIVKVISVSGDKVQAAHISFDFNDISTYIDPLKKDHKPRRFISV
jgi:hypothetical protein